MSKEFALTTIDNPFDPFTQFDEWFDFDCQNDYYSCNKLARLTNVTDDMSEEEANQEIERAINDFIANDFTNLYKKVSRNIDE